jgi:integrase
MCEHCNHGQEPLCTCGPVQGGDSFRMAVHLAENMTDVDWHLTYNSLKDIHPYQLCMVGKCKVCGGHLCIEQKTFGIVTTDDFLAAAYRHLYQFHHNLAQPLSTKAFREKFVEMFRKEDRAAIEDWLALPENSHVARMYRRSVKGAYEDTVIHTEPKSKTTVASDILFADYMIKWLGIIKNSVEVDTYAGYVNNVKKRIAPYFRELGVTLRNVTALDIENFYSYCFNELNLKGTTVQRFHANIHKAMKYAVKHDLIIANPMNKVERPKGQKYTGSFYSISELEELFDAIKGDPCEFPVLMAAFYGLRRSEIMGLRWQAIDFENNQITIDHTVVQCVCDGVAMTVEKDRTKNKSSCRSMPLVPQYRELLLSMKERQENCRKLCGNCYTESDYIFVNDLGVPYKPNYVTQHFKLVLQKHELRDIRFHDLRHTCASLLLKNGVPMKDIQEWLGHSDYNTTANIYAHLDTTSKSTSATRMTSVVSINPSICVNV